MDNQLLEIIIVSLKVSLTALAIGVLLGVPIGSVLGLTKFKGQGILLSVIYTLMGMPPVLAGLFIYLLISTKGPLGQFSLLFTPTAMVLAQVTLVVPIITGLTSSAVKEKQHYYWETAVSLGATTFQSALLILNEARRGIAVAIVTAFGRAIAEVGAVMLVGGNIEHYTRVMTTAIVLETRKGDFDLAMKLGLILLALSFVINGFITSIAFKRRDRLV